MWLLPQLSALSSAAVRIYYRASRDGEPVPMPSGYHPNVAVPGHPICFLWAMAAHREGEDRQVGVVNVQRGFDQGSSGLEAGRQK
jgi:5-deoxy-glucuronate isomerase